MHKTYYKSPIGYAEITASGDAIVSVNVLDRAPKKSLQSADAQVPILKKCMQELDEYFRGERQHFSVKLERQEGTDFQQKVWKALEKISFGKTSSYLDVAQKIGNAKAVRAVGAANGKNPHWIIVPCHRVIGKNKKLVGYSSGLWRKEWLLDHEKKFLGAQA